MILVDADLRKPGLHRIFDIADHKGLTNLLLGNATLDEALAQTQIQGLRVIFSGPLPPVPQNERAGRGAQELRRTGYLRQPAPPLGDRPHACGVSGRRCTPCGRRPAHTTGRVVKRGAETLQQANPGVIGTVLNKVSAKGKGNYYYYYYHYYAEDGADRKPPGRLGVLSRLLPSNWKSRRGGSDSSRKRGFLSRIRTRAQKR